MKNLAVIFAFVVVVGLFADSSACAAPYPQMPSDRSGRAIPCIWDGTGWLPDSGTVASVSDTVDVAMYGDAGEVRMDANRAIYTLPQGSHGTILQDTVGIAIVQTGYSYVYYDSIAIADTAVNTKALTYPAATLIVITCDTDVLIEPNASLTGDVGSGDLVSGYSAYPIPMRGVSSISAMRYWPSDSTEKTYIRIRIYY